MRVSKAHPQALYQLRKVTRFLAIAILLLVAVGFFLPSQYRVERSVRIQAAPEQVVEAILQGPQLATWMYIENGQLERQEGELLEQQSLAIHYQQTEQQGRLTLLKAAANHVAFEVLPKAGVSPVQNDLYVRRDGEASVVNWVIEGELNAGLLSPYIALLANNIAGQNFEKSLQKLQQLVEQTPQ